MAKDPVCGAEVDEKTTRFTSTYKNKAYYFHDESCKTKFDNTVNNLKKAGGGICYGVRVEDEKAVRE
jgi:YHS domain-containing protein